MNILLVSNVFPPGFIGGYELGASEVAKGLAKRGNQVTVLSSDYFQDESLEASPIEVHRILSSPALSHELVAPEESLTSSTYINFHNIRRLAHSIRTRHIDLVLLFNIWGLGALSILRFLSAVGMPTILYLMDDPLHQMDPNCAKCTRFAALFGPNQLGKNIRYIAMSNNVMEQFSKSLGYPMAANLFVPGWVHFDSLDVTAPSLRPDAPVRFVFCSRIAEHKGIQLALDAVEALAREGTTNFSVDFYGQGEVARLIQSIRARGLDRWASYRGFQTKDKMVRTLADYDGLVFPTAEREPFGFVVGEAAAAGCVPIMTAGIGASEWFVHEFDCLKMERSAKGLKDAMYQMIAMDHDARLQLRRSAWESARESLSFERWLPQIERECVAAASVPCDGARAATMGVQAAFQYLGQMWRESAV